MRAPIPNDAITVTTATRSEAEVRADLGVDAPVVEAPAAAVAAGDDAEKAATAEVDSDKPDAALSEAGRTLRLSRGDARKAKIQDEINALTRKREEERAAYEREKAERAKTATPPAERKPAADAAKPTADGKDSATPQFEFPTFDQWQVDHPDGDWIQYGDERADAREAFRAEQRAVAERAQADERAVTETFAKVATYQDTFKAAHPDYEAKLKSLDLAQYGVVTENGVIVQAPHQFIGLQRLLLRAGEAGPGILYYLADHPEDVARLLNPQTAPGDMLEMWGEIKYAAKAASPVTTQPAAAAAAAAAAEPAAPAAAPPRPRTSAPAPLTAVSGSSSVTKTPQQLSQDAGEDADDYIAVRQPGLLKRR